MSKLYYKFLKAFHNFLYDFNKRIDSLMLRLRREYYFVGFEDRDDDIYIVTFLKSGTTWMQVILYNMLTDGNMDFEHIYDVSPWPSNQAFIGEKVEKINNLPSPRILKSHDLYDRFDSNSKAKFIHIIRDGKDVAVSLYHHNKNYLDYTTTLDKTFEQYFTGNKNGLDWFYYNKEWIENKNNLNVLYISYEQLKLDFNNTITKIADFLNIELTEQKIKNIKEHSSFEYMKEHEAKFGEVSKDKKIYNQFIRNGNIGEGKKDLSQEQVNLFNERLNRIILNK